MKTNILFVERKPSLAVSIEKVFRQIAKNLSKEKFTIDFQSLEHSNGTLGTIKNLLLFRKRKADIYHITGHVHYIGLVLPKDKTILTIHDAGILHIRSGLRRFILKQLLFDLPIRRLKYITAVSETTKREVIRHTNCDEKKIRVIENPLQDDFAATAEKEFNKECPRILQIGTTANKNIERLIEAIETINCHLVIVGEIDAALINLLEEKKISYENKLKLSNEAVRDEYGAADIVAFCSTFEGFGLPIIEAQAMRTPVVTSNLSPMKEVAGAGAALADPHNPVSIRNCFIKIIDDEAFRQKIVAAGLENIKKYEPQRIAGLYEELYRKVRNASE